MTNLPSLVIRFLGYLVRAFMANFGYFEKYSNMHKAILGAYLLCVRNHHYFFMDHGKKCCGSCLWTRIATLEISVRQITVAIPVVLFLSYKFMELVA